MRLPRGPVVVGGELQREWRAAFAALGQLPRSSPEPLLQREWIAVFGARGAIPRGALYGRDGRLTREWRAYLEAL